MPTSSGTSRLRAKGRPSTDARKSSGSASFDGISHLYDRFAQLTQDDLARWVAEHLPPFSQEALDIGCGTGQFHDLLLARSEWLTGVDVSADQLQVARDRYRSSRVTYTLRRLDAGTLHQLGQYDLVFSSTALHHLGPADEVLRQVRCLVKPGGTLVVIDCIRPPQGILMARMGMFEWWRWLRCLHGAAKVLVRRRSWRDAALMFELRTHPTWRRLAAEALPLGKEEFDRVYTRRLPGARTYGLNSSTRGAVWRRSLQPEE
ncbi:class I SAM-dependent methyltransferase [Lentzea sp. NPDC059081]|uniref:class I SAM-dependent methyltransferase n=1 Tax=Lentzea sp. NPDC059081 TaxID=3346719 RepID=UPI0036C4721D